MFSLNTDFTCSYRIQEARLKNVTQLQMKIHKSKYVGLLILTTILGFHILWVYLVSRLSKCAHIILVR